MKLAGVDRRGKVMLCAAWITSSVCSMPQAIIFHVETHPNITHYQQCVTYNFFQDQFHEVIYSFIGMILMLVTVERVFKKNKNQQECKLLIDIIHFNINFF